MTALILDGKTLAASWEEQLTNRVTALKSRSNGRTPYSRQFWLAMTPPPLLTSR